MRNRNADKFTSEEGGRIAQALFTFMGKARMYNTAARDTAVRLIEKEMANESDPAEYEFFKTAVAFINTVDAKERAAMIAAYSGKE